MAKQKHIGQLYTQEQVDMWHDYARQMNRNDVLKEYRKLAKRANQRLVTLEKQGYKMPYGEAKLFLDKQGKTRFQERLTKYEKGKSTNELKREMEIIYNFLGSKQTTISGKKAIEKEVKERMKRDYDLSLDNDMFKDFMGSLNRLKDKLSFDYEDALKIAGDYFSQKKSISREDVRALISQMGQARNELDLQKRLKSKTFLDGQSFIKKLFKGRK